jgi:hypothetical protein
VSLRCPGPARFCRNRVVAEYEPFEREGEARAADQPEGDEDDADEDHGSGEVTEPTAGKGPHSPIEQQVLPADKYSFEGFVASS